MNYTRLESISRNNKAKELVAQLLGENENFSTPYDEVFNFVKKYHHGGVVERYRLDSPRWREQIAKGWDPSKDPNYLVKDGKVFSRNPKNVGGRGSVWDHSIWAYGKPSPELVAALPKFKWHFVHDHNSNFVGGFQIAAENAVEDHITSFIPTGEYPDVWFHVARRDPDIEINGLAGHMYQPKDWKHPVDLTYNPLSAVKRTYVFRPSYRETVKEAADDLAGLFYTQTDWQKGFDLYQIDTTGLRLRYDLNGPDGTWAYYDGPIKPERMKLVARTNSKNQFPASINRLA
jgi:hypothetical protein